MTYAEDLPYWKTSEKQPQYWLDKAEIEIERAGGEMLASGFGRDRDKAAYKTLPEEIKALAGRGLLPTLHGTTGGNRKDGTDDGHGNELGQAVKGVSGQTGPLNPRWCEAFQGFPDNWTRPPTKE